MSPASIAAVSVLSVSNENKSSSSWSGLTAAVAALFDLVGFAAPGFTAPGFAAPGFGARPGLGFKAGFGFRGGRAFCFSSMVEDEEDEDAGLVDSDLTVWVLSDSLGFCSRSLSRSSSILKHNQSFKQLNSAYSQFAILAVSQP